MAIPKNISKLTRKISEIAERYNFTVGVDYKEENGEIKIIDKKLNKTVFSIKVDGNGNQISRSYLGRMEEIHQGHEHKEFARDYDFGAELSDLLFKVRL